MAQRPTPELLRARVIYMAMIFGVVLMWIVIFVVLSGMNESESILDGTIALLLVIVISLGAFAAALFFRSRAAAAAGTAGSAPNQSQKDVSAVYTNLIVAWALLEGPALMAAVLFMLTNTTAVLLVGAVVFLTGYWMTFPKAEWFEDEQVAPELRS